MTKVYSGIPPTPPISENFRFGMTKVYSGIPPPKKFWKLQIWDDQSLLWNNSPPPQWKLSDSPSPRVSEYRELLHVETLSNPDNYLFFLHCCGSYYITHWVRLMGFQKDDLFWSVGCCVVTRCQLKTFHVPNFVHTINPHHPYPTRIQFSIEKKRDKFCV